MINSEFEKLPETLDDDQDDWAKILTRQEKNEIDAAHLLTPDISSSSFHEMAVGLTNLCEEVHENCIEYDSLDEPRKVFCEALKSFTEKHEEFTQLWHSTRNPVENPLYEVYEDYDMSCFATLIGSLFALKSKHSADVPESLDITKVYNILKPLVPYYVARISHYPNKRNDSASALIETDSGLSEVVHLVWHAHCDFWRMLSELMGTEQSLMFSCKSYVQHGRQPQKDKDTQMLQKYKNGDLVDAIGSIFLSLHSECIQSDLALEKVYNAFVDKVKAEYKLVHKENANELAERAKELAKLLLIDVRSSDGCRLGDPKMVEILTVRCQDLTIQRFPSVRFGDPKVPIYLH